MKNLISWLAKLWRIIVAIFLKRKLEVGAAGVVLGDLCTSFIYTNSEVFLHGIKNYSRSDVIEITSLILWLLTSQISGKYVCNILKADYHKEGGIFAILGLVKSNAPWLLTILLVFGAGCLYADGTLTPVISVISAVEGVKSLNPFLGDHVKEITRKACPLHERS